MLDVQGVIGTASYGSAGHALCGVGKLKPAAKTVSFSEFEASFVAKAKQSEGRRVPREYTGESLKECTEWGISRINEAVRDEMVRVAAGEEYIRQIKSGQIIPPPVRKLSQQEIVNRMTNVSVPIPAPGS